MDRHPVNCSDVSHNLPWYVGGDLEEPVALLVREHLAACPECERAHARARASRERLLASGVGPQGGVASSAPDLWPGVRARLVQEGLLEEAAPVRMAAPEPVALSGGRILRPRFAMPLAAAAAAVLLFTWSPWSGMGSGGVQPDELKSAANLGDPAPPAGSNVPLEDLLAKPEDAPAGVVPLRRVSAGDDSVLERYNRAQLEQSGPNGPGAATNGTSLTGQTFRGRRLR